MKKTTEVAKAKQTLPAAIDFAADAGAGLEHADQQSMAIPFLTILQALSPQLETVAGAKQGMIVDSISNELFTELEVVPCGYKRSYLRWADREAGGGFKGEYSALDIEAGRVEGVGRSPEGRPTLEGDLLSDTRTHYVLYKDKSGSWKPAVISMASTQIKKSKRWMTLIQGKELRRADGTPFTPPSFAYVYKFTTQKEENAKGRWYGWSVIDSRQVEDSELYARAKALHQQVGAGEVQVQQPDNQEEF